MIGAWLAKCLGGVSFRFILWGVRQAIAIHAGMPGARYRLRIMDGGLMPVHYIEVAGVLKGFLSTTRADARDFVHDANMGAFMRELVAADDAEQAERKAKKPNA